MARIIPRRPPLRAPAALLIGQGYRNLRAGAGALTVSIPLLAGSGSVSSEEPAEDSLTADAYSDYNTLHVNLSSGSDSASGTSELTAKRTLQAAAAIATPFTRILVQGDAALTAHVTLPVSNAGFMGYPDKPMPNIELGNFNFRYSANGARSNTFARKLHLFGQTNGLSGIEVGLNNAQNGFRAEFLWVHDIFGTDDNCAAIYLRNGAAHNAYLTHCKLGNVRVTPGGSFFHNGPTVLSYGNDGTVIDHCELYEAQYGFRSKAAPNGGVGPKIRYTKIRDIFPGSQGPAGVRLGRDAGGGSYNDTEFIGNLIQNIEEGPGLMLFDPSVVAERVEVRQNTFAEDVWNPIEIRNASVNWVNNVFAGTGVAVMTKESYTNRLLDCDGNAYRQGCSWILGEYLSGSNRRVYSTLAAWKSAKTTHNHVDLSQLTAANPDLNGHEFSSLTDTFIAHTSRNYGIRDTSPIKGSGIGGVDPGYDPNNCGPGW